jgi:hypothetical protein
MMPVTSSDFRVDLQALGRHHVGTGGLAGVEQAVLVHLDRHRSDFQQALRWLSKPPVSTSTTTGRKPRKRCDIARCAWGGIGNGGRCGDGVIHA